MSSVSVTRPARLGLACACAALVLVTCVVTGCASRPLAAEGAARSATTVPVRMPVAHDAGTDVKLLRSPSFVERSHAADRLVTLGEDALPLLGAAGDASVRVYGTQDVPTTRPVVRAILEDLPQARLYAHLDGAWPTVRREAAEELGRRGRLSAVPYLLPRMDDEDRGVRAAAVSSLRRLTNQFFGYDPGAHFSARRAAANRWNDWWDIQGRVRAERDDDGAG
jgi:hypothetical protein